MNLFAFYRGKRVFLTGHTGFKGLWLAKILSMAGAKVTGYALPPTGEREKLFAALKGEEMLHSVYGDVRDFERLFASFKKAEPEILFHLAAQPLVLESYRDPVGTYSANVLGTVHILECVRLTKCVRSFLNVTTDKVYDNKEWCWGYRETDPLGGKDPYAAGKACSELVTASYRSSFFTKDEVAISTARAGNVIGGGDFGANRIVPDCVRAAYKGEVITLRHPRSVRPYQHVLEPLSAYLTLGAKQYIDPSISGTYNIGPDPCDCVDTRTIASLFCKAWGEDLSYKEADEAEGKEAGFLRLDNAKAREILGWEPRWNISKAIEETVKWAKVYRQGGDIIRETEREIKEFFTDEET